VGGRAAPKQRQSSYRVTYTETHLSEAGGKATDFNATPFCWGMQ